MSWMRHLATGFTELGHEVKIVASTKSGRPRTSWGETKWGGHWSVFAPELTVKDSELAAALSSFDLIVLPEPKVPLADKEALKVSDATVPLYVTALYAAGVPFIFALHGNNYDPESAPFLDSLVVCPNFIGRIISHSPRSTKSLDSELWYHTPVIDSPLPYAPKREINARREYTATVGTTGRFMFNKGSHVVAFAAKHYVPEDTTVELWGSAAAGLGASTTFGTYEALLPQAKQYVRYGDQAEKIGQPNATEHGNIIRPYLWDIRLVTGQLVRYLGNYTNAVDVCERLAVHVNLTGYKYSGGLVEYTTLEALDAGCISITTEHVSDDRFQTLRIDLENPPGSPSTAIKDTELLETIGNNVNGALAFALHGDPEIRQSMVEANREALREVNSAKTVAETFIQGAFE